MAEIIKLTVTKGRGYDRAIDQINNLGYTIVDAYTDKETDDFIITYTK